MKKRVFKILLIIGALLVIPITYINSSSFIENQEWKYIDGAHIGDWLTKTNFDIEDRIIHSYHGKAKIVFSFGFRLIIRDIRTNQTGFYTNKK
ncbi:hypothetical protein [uncultured Wocania sp.]|uniref:hypothetical protein n=1 Tax=uncultured Wocania sp. TaxID=2834404 RepID=UPI0030F6A736